MKLINSKSNRLFKAEIQYHLMVLPGLILIAIYNYMPTFGITMAFQNYIPVLGVSGSEWVGLDNFKYLFYLPDTLQIFWNTFFIAVMKLAADLIVPLITALLLNEVRLQFFKRSVQTLIYLPHFLSWVILSGILIDILSPSQGIVNQFIRLVGADPVYFLGDNRWFRYVIVVTNEWKEFGFGTIVYLAALAGINPDLYEAAVVDGAGRWKQTWHITLPGMRPIIVLLLTLSLGSVLNAGFDQIFNLLSPQVFESGDIIDTAVYRMGLLQSQYSLATAVGLLKSVISLVLISASYWLSYRFANYRIF